MVEQKSKEEWLFYDKLKLHEILILMSMSEISLEARHAVWFTCRPRPLPGREDGPESWAGVWPESLQSIASGPLQRKRRPRGQCGPAVLSVRSAAGPPATWPCVRVSRAVRESDVCQGRRWRGEGTWVGFPLVCEGIRCSETLWLERSTNCRVRSVLSDKRRSVQLTLEQWGPELCVCVHTCVFL